MTPDDRGEAFRDGIRPGRSSAATEIRSAILDLLHPDDPPAREYALRECVQAVERCGGLAPIPTAGRTGHA